MAAAMLQQNQRNGGLAEFQGLMEFRRNNPSQFNGEYDPEKAELWIQEMEKIFEAMMCPNERRVTYATFMLTGDAEYWWRGARRLLEAEGREITWEIFRTTFLEKYFPTNVRHAKEMEFLQLKQGRMLVGEYAAKFESLSKFSRYFQLQPDEEWKCRKFEDGLWYEIREAVVPLEIREFPVLLNKCRMIEDIKRSREGRPRDFGSSRFKKRDDRFKKKPYTRPQGNSHPYQT